jgi:hypothetical protein
MAYSIHGENGYVDGGPSINGLREFRKEIERKRNRGHFPRLEEFLEKGFSPNPRLLAKECRVLAGTIKNKDVLVTCEMLAQSARKCGQVVILSDDVS